MDRLSFKLLLTKPGVYKMKMSKEHYNKIETIINNLDTNKVKQHYEKLKRDAMVKDLATRFRWDCLWAATRKDRSLFDDINKYKDIHIDTALKMIVKNWSL